VVYVRGPAGAAVFEWLAQRRAVFAEVLLHTDDQREIATMQGRVRELDAILEMVDPRRRSRQNRSE
jgi:hypothetical protein